ncbi:unnamed protein product [Plutella xylostella]|uniref:(diamondback moth) hypothetical protein n=1 Tax=Plutella xylostella TaxID=51655 RepID=A0A8S4DJ72_PLUXY|nr:unnamed protein product [Plutella xylostella]
MGRVTAVKWEKSTPIKPSNNIISSDFAKYCPQQWKFMASDANICLLLCNEYQRMWLSERDDWKKRMYNKNTTAKEDAVKRNVSGLKNNVKSSKPEVNKPLKLKKFENVSSKAVTKRASKESPQA